MTTPRRPQRAPAADADVRQLAEADVRRIAREELRAVLRVMLSSLDGPAEGYSSRRGCGAPGYSAGAWAALAKRIGVRRGRWWHVSREALAAHEAGQSETRPANDTPTPKPARPWHPAMSAEAAGLRRSSP